MVKRNRKATIVLLIVFGISCLIFPLIFSINFYSHNISKDITDWGAFGDYISGTLNTIISLLSLIVLSYISYLISEQSNLENKNTNILLRRMDSYEKLTSYLPELNKFFPEMRRSMDLMKNKLKTPGIDYHTMNTEMVNFIKKLGFFKDFYYFLFSFYPRFSHLYKYDFNCDEYIRLLDNAKLIDDYYDNLKDAFEFNNAEAKDIDFKVFNDFFEDLTNVMKKLKSELN
jgi:hypothetical protein